MNWTEQLKEGISTDQFLIYVKIHRKITKNIPDIGINRSNKIW